MIFFGGKNIFRGAKRGKRALILGADLEGE